MIAQACHASIKVWFDRMTKGWGHGGLGEIEEYKISLYGSQPKLTPKMIEWKEGLFTKIIVGCDSEEELLELQRKADEMCIHSALITDAGLTEFHGIPTITCIAIGTDDNEKIDEITGHLKLL